MKTEKEPEEIGFQDLFVQLNRAYASKCFRQMAALGLHPGQIPFIMLLSQHEDMSQKEIAEELKAAHSQCHGAAYGESRNHRTEARSG